MTLKGSVCIVFIFLQAWLCAQNTDLQLLRSINSGRMPGWDNGMKVVSHTAYGISAAGVIGTWTHGYFTKNEKLKRSAFKSAFAIGFAMAVTAGLKYTVNRTRPYDEYPNDIIRRDFGNGPYSFPSGHTTSAFSTATALSLSYKKWYVTAPAFVYAGFVGYSRMRLGVHYPTDVLGGAVIGIGSGFLTWFIDKKLHERKQQSPKDL